MAVGGHPAEMQTIQGQGQAGRGLRPAGGAGDHLGQHGVEVHRHRRAGFHPAVPAHRRFVGWLEGGQGPHRGKEPGRRVLGVEPGLDGVPGRGHVVLGKAQRLAHRHPELLADQVDVGHLLGDRVLDLEPGVDLQEIELAGVVVEQELDRARRPVADRAGQPHRGLTHPGPQIGVHRGRRRLLDDLLVAALYGTLPFAEMDAVAVGVGQDLDLDMAGPGHVPL